MSSGQFGHISQFYQTLLLISIFILAGFQILSFVFNINQRLFKHSINEYKQELQWQTHKTQSLQSTESPNPQQEQQNDLEKSVTNYVQNEISNMQKTHEQPKPQHETQQHNLPLEPEEPQLPPNQLKFFTVYVAFNTFISEKMAVLIPLLVLGILTTSTYIYTLVAFFCAFICDLIAEIVTAQEKSAHVQNSKFGLKQGVKILGNAFVLSIFISYWAVQQFSPS